MSTSLLADQQAAHQQATPPSCPADRPVDEIIGEVNRQQSKKASRNRNPFPSVGCIWGWCRDMGRTPPTIPNPPTAPAPDTSSGDDRSRTPGESGSKTPAEQCNERTELALEAAHNVDVGDLQVEEQHYKAALSRYEEAATQKPGDAAIHVRLGRVLEKLNEGAKAGEHYKAAEQIGTPQKWAAEARKALARLNASNK